jgi:glycosyltransferase involved in cell wall biosynthesis
VTRIDVSLLTLGDPNTPTGGYLYHRRMSEAAPRHDAAISFVSFPIRPFPLAMLAGRSVIDAAGGADVVVLDSIAACFAVPWLGRLRRDTPLVAMLHQPPGGIDYGGLRRRITARLDLAAYRKVDRLLVASESLKAAMESSFRDVIVVPPGRDVAPPGIKGGIDIRSSRRLAVLCVGNWLARKGIIDTLEAVARLPDDYVTLHLVGDERLDDRYGLKVAARIERPDLSGRVVRHRVLSRDQVASLYRSADVFLLPSYAEPYGTVLGEAMAEGLAVVGYRAGNLPYLARHGEEALMAEPGDVAELALLLRRLAENEDLRSSLGAAARERAQSFPTWDESAAVFFGALRETVAARR